MNLAPLFAGWVLAQPTVVREPYRLAVAPLVLTAPCKFAGPDRERTLALISKSATEYLEGACMATDIVLISPAMTHAAIEDGRFDFSKSGHRSRTHLQEFGKRAGAHYAAIAVVEWTDQKNAELSAIVSSPATAKSSSRVRLRIWLQNVTDDVLMIDGSKQVFEGESKGPYFGTVNPRDMSGDPTAKGIAIENEYRQRAKWLGKAVVLALRSALQGPLGLKDPQPAIRG